MEKIDVEMLYILTDEDGEVHAPKKRFTQVEIALSQMLISRLRQQVLDDLLLLSTNCAPLSAGYWRQLGMLDRATEVQQGGQPARMTPQQAE